MWCCGSVDVVDDDGVGGDDDATFHSKIDRDRRSFLANVARDSDKGARITGKAGKLADVMAGRFRTPTSSNENSPENSKASTDKEDN
jgi:hypothetical protein